MYYYYYCYYYCYCYRYCYCYSYCYYYYYHHHHNYNYHYTTLNYARLQLQLQLQVPRPAKYTTTTTTLQLQLRHNNNNTTNNQQPTNNKNNNSNKYHYSRLHYNYITHHYATATTSTTLQLHLQLQHYNFNNINYTTTTTKPQLQLQIHYTTLRHTTSFSCGWGDHCNHCNHSRNHNYNHLSVHQWIRSPCITTTYLSYRFPILEISAAALCSTTGIKYDRYADMVLNCLLVWAAFWRPSLLRWYCWSVCGTLAFQFWSRVSVLSEAKTPSPLYLFLLLSDVLSPRSWTPDQLPLPQWCFFPLSPVDPHCIPRPEGCNCYDRICHCQSFAGAFSYSMASTAKHMCGSCGAQKGKAGGATRFANFSWPPHFPISSHGRRGQPWCGHWARVMHRACGSREPRELAGRESFSSAAPLQ